MKIKYLLILVVACVEAQRAPSAPVTSCGIVNGQERNSGDSWKDDCNTCVCRESGIATCTKLFCGNVPRINFPNEPVTSCGIVNGQERQVGDSWKDDCNICVCRESGIFTCTKLFCGNIPRITDPCSELFAVVGTCEAIIPSWSYNQETGKCEYFEYGGCEGNNNKFENQQHCQKSCERIADPCSEPFAEVGTCEAIIPSWSYNHETGKCEYFEYGGCEGNNNKFENQQHCQKSCEKIADPCSEPFAEVGTCEAIIPSWSYNQETGKCEYFEYGGCEGNNNRFEDQKPCQHFCEKAVNGSSNQTGACFTTKNVPCRFPFIYKDVSYDKCTYVDTINHQPWCATVGKVRLTRSGAVLGARQVGDCDLKSNCQVEEEEDDYEDQTDSESYGPCTFTHDCLGEGSSCEHIADATCVCNFGRCLVRGFDIERWVQGAPQTRNKECSNHTDCPCRNETDKCFCIDEKCVNESWECHDDKECSSLSKCDGKQCTCTEGTCEWQCDITQDCVNKNDAFFCQHLGYECKCLAGQCKSVELTEECKEPGFGVEDPALIKAGLSACVKLGKCSPDLPCQCLNNYCTKPWYANQDGDCREKTGVKDCSNTILDCIGDKCVCENIIQIDEWTRMGVCAPKPSK